MTDEQGVAGKVVAVTGASEGIGRAIATHLAARGARLLLGARNAERLDELVRQITGAGGEALAVPTDVRRREDLAALVTTAVSSYGRLDVLVSNAGIATVAPMTDVDLDAWEAMVEVNVLGLLRGYAAAMPVFLEQGSGHFVNVLSTSGIKIVAGQAVYAGTKNAGRTVAEAMRQESQGRYRVTSISPGMVATEFAQRSSSAPDDDLAAQVAAVAIPPEAVARCVAFAIQQPGEVEIGELVVRPTVQG